MVKINWINHISRKTLQRRLAKDLKRRWIGSEHWFIQNRSNMRRLYDPKHFTRGQSLYSIPSGELYLLKKYKTQLTHLAKNRTLVFWGTGKKEAEFINNVARINNRHTSVIFIDIEKETIRRSFALLNTLAKKRFNLTGLVGLFQSFVNRRVDSAADESRKHDSVFHVCLGTTIGNFDQNEMFTIFQKNMRIGDYLLLGFQLNVSPNKILAEYRDDENFTRAVKLPIFEKLEKSGAGKTFWRFHKPTHAIELIFQFRRDETVSLQI